MIEKLKSIDFHDAPIKSFKINFEKEEIIMKVLHYNESAKVYFTIEMKFSNVSNLQMDSIPEVSILEILNVDIVPNNNGIFSIHLLLAYDVSTIHIKLSFDFGNVEIG